MTRLAKTLAAFAVIAAVAASASAEPVKPGASAPAAKTSPWCAWMTVPVLTCTNNGVCTFQWVEKFICSRPG
jgi:hypothetical protein